MNAFFISPGFQNLTFHVFNLTKGFLSLSGPVSHNTPCTIYSTWTNFEQIYNLKSQHSTLSSDIKLNIHTAYITIFIHLLNKNKVNL